MSADGEEIPMPKGLNYYLENTSEIFSEDIFAHIIIEVPELAYAQ